jgi:hypothetical protein
MAANWRRVPIPLRRAYCDVPTATCTGTLATGASGHIDVSGRLPTRAAVGDSYAVTARATVADTSRRSRTARLTASVKALVGAAAPAPATGGVVLPLSMPLPRPYRRQSAPGPRTAGWLRCPQALLAPLRARTASARPTRTGRTSSARPIGSSCPRRSVRYMRSIGPTQGRRLTWSTRPSGASAP